MATDTAGSIYVDVQARLNKLDAGLKQAEQKVATSAGRMNRLTKIGGATEAAAAALMMMAKIQIIMGSIEGGGYAVQAIIAKLRGDAAGFGDGMMKAADAFKRVPIIGGLVSSLERTLGMVTGIGPEIDAINRALKEQGEIISENQRRASTYRGIAGAADTLGGQLGNEQALLATTDEGARNRIRARQEYAGRIAAIDERLAEAERKGLDEGSMLWQQLQDTKLSARRSLSMKLGEIDRKEQEDEARLAEQRMKKQLDRAQRLAALDGEISAGRLRQRGDDLAAEIVLIESRYDREIETARGAADEIARLEELKQQEVYDARRRAEEREQQDRERLEKEERNAADRLARLDGQIQERTLQAQGRVLDARLSAIRAGYDAEIRAAQGNADEIARLERLKALDVAAAQREAASAVPTRTSFRQFDSSLMAFGGQGPSAATKPIKIEGQDKSLGLLSRIETNTRSNSQVARVA